MAEVPKRPVGRSRNTALLIADAAKRPVGRPRKNPVAGAGKRPVGRPKKNSSTDTKPKRRIERPKKSPLAVDGGVKRRVGRPRKNPLATIDAPKRRVGRPRKNGVSAGDKAVQERKIDSIKAGSGKVDSFESVDGFNEAQSAVSISVSNGGKESPLNSTGGGSHRSVASGAAESSTEKSQSPARKPGRPAGSRNKTRGRPRKVQNITDEFLAAEGEVDSDGVSSKFIDSNNIAIGNAESVLNINIEKILSKVKANGYVSYPFICDVLGDLYPDIDNLDNLCEEVRDLLQANNIDVFDNEADSISDLSGPADDVSLVLSDSQLTPDIDGIEGSDVKSNVDLQKLYFKDVNAYPLLTHAEEKSVSREIDEGRVNVVKLFGRVNSVVDFAIGRILEICEAHGGGTNISRFISAIYGDYFPRQTAIKLSVRTITAFSTLALTRKNRLITRNLLRMCWRLSVI